MNLRLEKNDNKLNNNDKNHYLNYDYFFKSENYKKYHR